MIHHKIVVALAIAAAVIAVIVAAIFGLRSLYYKLDRIQIR
jgi:hypothetical protein